VKKNDFVKGSQNANTSVIGWKRMITICDGKRYELRSEER
jgi:hypothetical protein